MTADRDALAAIDALHQPSEGIRRMHPVTHQVTDQRCDECDQAWPCNTARALDADGWHLTRDDLGAAWAEAEAALPMAGWESGGRWVIPYGTWGISVRYFPADGDGVHEPYYPPKWEAQTDVHPGFHRVADGDTPAAALRALAARLRDPEPAATEDGA